MFCDWNNYFEEWWEVCLATLTSGTDWHNYFDGCSVTGIPTLMNDQRLPCVCLVSFHHSIMSDWHGYFDSDNQQFSQLLWRSSTINVRGCFDEIWRFTYQLRRKVGNWHTYVNIL